MDVLVWGATDDRDSSCRVTLFPGGPSAYDIREYICRSMDDALDGVTVIFSENGDTFGHHHENAGFYEPLQLAEAKVLILIFPSNRPMAVNTWETALALESAFIEKSSISVAEKIIFVMPKSAKLHMDEAFRTGISDLKDFHSSREGGEIVLGPANSFAARWIHMACVQEYDTLIEELTTGSAKSHGLSMPSPPIIVYDDENPWGLHDSSASQLINEIK